MENETNRPAQPEPVAESKTLQEIRRTRREIEEGVRHLERVDQACVHAMLLALDLLIELHQRQRECPQAANVPRIRSQRRDFTGALRIASFRSALARPCSLQTSKVASAD